MRNAQVLGGRWSTSGGTTSPQDQKRAHLRHFIRSVTISKADPKRRRWQPIDERIAVTWVDGTAAAAA
jgi:hypothetical protein